MLESGHFVFCASREFRAEYLVWLYSCFSSSQNDRGYHLRALRLLDSWRVLPPGNVGPGAVCHEPSASQQHQHCWVSAHTTQTLPNHTRIAVVVRDTIRSKQSTCAIPPNENHDSQPQSRTRGTVPNQYGSLRCATPQNHDPQSGCATHLLAALKIIMGILSPNMC